MIAGRPLPYWSPTATQLRFHQFVYRRPILYADSIDLNVSRCVVRIDDMARELNRLTALAVKNAHAPANAKGPKLIADGGGLYLQIMPAGTKSWLFRYTYAGKPKAVGLGSIQNLSLAAARERASDLRNQVRRGIDPQLEKAQQLSHLAGGVERGKTFRECADEFVDSIAREHRNAKHHAQWRSSLETYAYPVIGDVPVASITVHMIREVMSRDDAWLLKNETISRVRGRIERILGWATVLGYRSGENPARWKNYLSEVFPSKKTIKKVRHHPAIPYRELPTFMLRLRAQPLSMARFALEFLTLTAARTGEVIGARWSEVNWSDKTWTVPAERMKAGREHRVPLSAFAGEILLSIRHQADGDFIFRGMKYQQPISNMAMLELMRRMKCAAVPHGMRSAFRDWCAEQTTYPRELAEAALAHALENRVEAAYQRGDLLDRRRALMNDWANYCSGSVSVSVRAQLDTAADALTTTGSPLLR